MRYTQDDPKWVKAESAVDAGGGRVTVTAYGESWTVTPGWSDPFFDKSKSAALVRNRRGDWLKVWWFDSDVKESA